MARLAAPPTPAESEPSELEKELIGLNVAEDDFPEQDPGIRWDEQRFENDWNVLRRHLDGVDINLLPDGVLPRLAVTVASGAGVNLLQGRYGERTDIGAHVAGFAAGTLLGVGLAGAGDRVPQGASAQKILGVDAVGLFGLARLLALRAHG